MAITARRTQVSGRGGSGVEFDQFNAGPPVCEMDTSSFTRLVTRRTDHFSSGADVQGSSEVG